jgi:hypothetical protein
MSETTTTKPVNGGGTALAPTGATPPSGITRQQFGATELEITGETAGTAAAATAKALVEARFIMAMRRPRDWADVRTKLLRAIERPGFAGKAGAKAKPGEAWYHKPVGDGVEGFSIRFAEEALRCMGNVDVRPSVVYEDSEKRLVDVMVLDLENNIAFTSSVVVSKTVERSFLKEGEFALRMRLNSKNKPVYTREATKDEITVLQNSEVSKTMRNEILRLLPGDIQAEARERILAIRFGDAATDPDGVQKEVADGFSKLNVLPSGLKQYLGHELRESTPAELTELRELYKAINGGKTTWHQAIAEALAERGEEPATTPGDGQKPTTLDAAAEALKAKAPTSSEGPQQQEPGEDRDDPAAVSDAAVDKGPKPSEAAGPKAGAGKPTGRQGRLGE